MMTANLPPGQQGLKGLDCLFDLQERFALTLPNPRWAQVVPGPDVSRRLPPLLD